jgi:hypothetical protein
MAKVYQRYLFSWKDIDDLGDLERFQLVIENMPDEKLIQTLAHLRGHGRKDYPAEAMWNSILAGIVYQHNSIESLRRELQRNAQLREMCGFDPWKGSAGVPSKSAYNRFLLKILKNKNLIEELFDSLVEKLKEVLPDLGKDLAFDSKAISSHATKEQKENNDKRGEHDADWGTKTYKGINKDGTAWEKTKSWFGFKLHLIVDANYELPVAMELTKASVHDFEVMPDMFQKMKEMHPAILETCEHAIGDKGYDDTNFIATLWDRYHIKPMIDIRNMWKDGEETRLLEGVRYENITHDYKGTIFCHCPKTGEVKKMAYGGFEKDRNTHKYLCPAMHYGCECKGFAQCPLKKGVRIPLDENRRIFTPVARSSYKWKKVYNKRSSVERINSRIHTSYGFEKHYIRGYAKMHCRCALSLCVMLAIAYGRILQKQAQLMRSLVKAA